MQLIICDDDKLFIQKLQHCLQLFFKQHRLILPKIITFTSGEELLSYTGSIDILFLDIEMPGMNGLEAAEQILQADAAGQEPVDGRAQLCLVAGAVLRRLMLNV